MMYVLQIENEIADSQVEDFLIEKYSLTKNDINKLLDDNIDAKVTYEIRLRDNLSEFKTELIFFLKEEICLELKIYNSFQVALSFIEYFSKNVIIKDESHDPYRWILLTNLKKIFIVDEVIYDHDEILSLNYKTVKEITISKAMSVLPDRNYFLIKPEDRPVYFNQDPLWGSE